MERGLFPTTVVGSMPRPQYVRDLIESQVEGGGSSGDFRRMMTPPYHTSRRCRSLPASTSFPTGNGVESHTSGVIADICSGFDLSIKEVLGQRQTWHVVTSKIEVANPGLLAREARFLKLHTGRYVKVAMPSPYLLGERMWDPELSRAAYPTRRDFPEALVPVLRQELEALRDEGVAIAQIDDPHLCLFVDPKVQADYDDPQAELAYCVDLLNRVVKGVDGVRLAVHLCRRNKGRAGWVGEGGYEPILPALAGLKVDILMLEFAIPAAGDFAVLRDIPERFDIGLGCVDCRSSHIDTPDEIAARVRRAAQYVAPERVLLHPDCVSRREALPISRSTRRT